LRLGTVCARAPRWHVIFPTAYHIKVGRARQGGLGCRAAIWTISNHRKTLPGSDPDPGHTLPKRSRTATGLGTSPSLSATARAALSEAYLSKKKEKRIQNQKKKRMTVESALPCSLSVDRCFRLEAVRRTDISTSRTLIQRRMARPPLKFFSPVTSHRRRNMTVQPL